jgi:predicted ArsR family transcriptional regulator
VAAVEIAGRVARLRERVVAALRSHGPHTADEIAGILGEDILSIRPRFSELGATGAIIKTADRRPNPRSGLLARVWRVVDQRGVP